MPGTLIPQQPVHIYGAGFSGLSLAYRLKRENISFKLFENKTIGGKIATLQTPFGPVERAASSLYMNRYAEKFLQELKLPYLKPTEGLKRKLWSPHGPVSPMSAALILRLFTRGWKAWPAHVNHLSVEEVFLPLLGQQLVDELLSPALGGIHGARASELHFLSLFPFAKDQSFKNYFAFLKALKDEASKEKAEGVKGGVSFAGGMQKLIDTLLAEVRDEIEITDGQYQAAPNTALCTTAFQAAELLKTTHPDIALELLRIRYLSMYSLTIFTQQKLKDLENTFGMLIPQKYASIVSGIIHQSAVYPENFKTAACYTIIGKGSDHSAEEILSEVCSRVSDFDPSQIVHSELTRWENALPLFDENRYQALANIQQLLKNRPGLLLLGNYTEGISLRSMIAQTSSLKSLFADDLAFSKCF